MDFQEFKNLVIAAAEAKGLTEYELYYQTSEETSVEAFRHEINAFSSTLEGGVCFRCIYNGKMGYASSQALNEAEAVSLVEQAMEGASVLETEEEVFLGEGGQTYAELPPSKLALATTDELRELALASQDALYAADPMVVDGTQSQTVAQKMSIAICNSKGLDLSHECTINALIGMAVVSNGEEMAESYDFSMGDLKEIKLDAYADKIVKKAIAKLGGEPAPTGSYPVIFSAGAMADLLATFSPVFSSKNAQKGLSRLKGQEGEMVASPVVTLVDDPFYEKSLAKMPFDAEGSPTYRKNVIEAGKLETLLYNLETAYKEGRKTTGNASKGNYASPVSINPFTMYLAPGEMTEDELLEKAQNGVYINFLGGLHAGANEISGDFSLQSGGFLIENGKKTSPVKSFTVAGNFFQLLKGITAVASNLEVPNPSNTTAYGSPSVLVEGLSIAGK